MGPTVVSATTEDQDYDQASGWPERYILDSYLLRQGSRAKSFTQCMSLEASCLTVPLQTSLTVAKSDNTTSASGYVALKREGSCSVVVMAHVGAKRRLLIKLRTRSIG